MNQLLLETITCCGVTEYSVTLVTGQTTEHEDLYVEGVEKTHKFKTEDEAKRCFKHLIHIVKNTPFAALKQFNRYGKTGRDTTHFAAFVGHTRRIRHGVKLADGSKSYWTAQVWDYQLVRNDGTCVKFYDTLGAFASAHYKDEHPTRKTGKGWDECETLIFGEWVKMSVMREIRA